jgi:uncharacterized protein
VIALDTTVLVYALGGAHPLAEPARALVTAIERGLLRATTTVEAVQEFVDIRARRRGRADAAGLGRSFATLLSPLLSPDADDLAAGLAVFEETALGASDSVLAATVMSRGGAIVSADGAFATVAGLDLRPLDGPWVAGVGGR